MNSIGEGHLDGAENHPVDEEKHLSVAVNHHGAEGNRHRVAEEKHPGGAAKHPATEEKHPGDDLRNHDQHHPDHHDADWRADWVETIRLSRYDSSLRLQANWRRSGKPVGHVTGNMHCSTRPPPSQRWTYDECFLQQPYRPAAASYSPIWWLQSGSASVCKKPENRLNHRSPGSHERRGPA